MKKIVVLNGSPHADGCTAALAGVVVKSAESQGALVKSYYLNGMRIRGCQGCFQCAETGRCVQTDDMQPLYENICDADGIILASPVYMWSMSAQLKTAVDRLFAFLRPGHTSALKPGKKVLLLFTQGQKDTDMFRHYFEHVGKNMQFMGFGEYKILVAGGTHRPEEVLCQKDVAAQAEALGKWLSD
ncbi:MAG: flavodoxin family protein [Clostridiales bacterium]|nr:flavodoxin family protein [Clostridiales bacterium]